MCGIDSRLETFHRRVVALAVALAILAVVSTGYARSCLAQQAGQERFSTAEQASHGLFQAVKDHDERAATRILGAGKELISSDDEVQDKLDRERFVQKYEQMHRLVRQADGAMLLYVGAENWPFPVPLVSNRGAWYFDAKAGMEEVLLRRIGENELSVIQVCHARGIEKSAGAHAPPYEHGPVIALLMDVGKGGPAVAFHGYYFRRLESSQAKSSASAAAAAATDSRTGKTADQFAFVVYPAVYRSTGVMTFVVDRDGVVYEKDLGPNTAAMTKAMTEHTPDTTWHRLDELDVAG
jgi:hypothetical protein